MPSSSLRNLAAQISYYSDYIQRHLDWEFVQVFADEAKTGTKNTRPEFQRMLDECRAGRIDMVITKTISRLARNTVTILESVRALKELGIDIYFEEQNIHSLSGDGELMLTILSSYAQEESRSCSENCKWHIRKQFAEGRPTGGNMLGYKQVGGMFTIIPEEAELVRQIFEDYLAGMGFTAIEKKLHSQGIKFSKSAITKKSNVTIIPASISMIAGAALGSPTAKRRVAAYARVSTDSTEQENSYTAQCDYYTKYINEHPDWEFVSVYSDEGITGCNTKRREGFKNMIADALTGKIDLIITKSVSRFARNTVDSLQTIWKLKENGVECFFEKKNIWTFDGKGELLITIMSSIAQEESRSISANVTWGKRRSFEEGKVSLPYTHFLGYERGEDGKPKIVEKEAKVVRLIYDMYLQGHTINGICKHLTEKGIPTPSGKTNWGVSAVNSILRNEKYAGNALLQKRFCTDYLTKHMKKNEGEVPQYFVEGSHPGIVDPVIFNLVQERLQRNREIGNKRITGQVFSGMIYCGDCKTGVYGSKTWCSGTPYVRRVWQCNEKYKVKGRVSCDSPHMTDDELKRVFIIAFNKILCDKDVYIDAYAPIIEALTDTSKLDSEIAVLRERCAGMYTEIESLIKDNANRAQQQDAYRERHAELSARYEDLNAQLSAVEAEQKNRVLRKHKIQNFLDKLRDMDGLLQEFDESIFMSVTERITVYSKRTNVVTFRDGHEVTVDISE